MRNGDYVFVDVRQQDITRATAVKQASGIGEYGAKLYAARRSVDHAADRFDASLLGVKRSVVEHKLHVRQRRQRFVHRAVFAGQVEQLILRQGEINVHIGVVRYGGQRLGNRCAHQGTHTIRQDTDYAVGRTFHFGIGEVVGRIDELCLGLCQLGFCRQQVVLGSLQVELRNDVLGEQLFFAVVGQLSGGYAGLGSCDVGFCGLQGCLVGHLVDNEQQLSLANYFTLFNAHFGNGTRYLRVNGDVLAPTDGCRVGARNRYVRCRNCHDGIFRLASCRRSLAARYGESHAASEQDCLN